VLPARRPRGRPRRRRYIAKPRGDLHAMWNAGTIPARMIEIISPAGFEHFFPEVVEMLAEGPPSPQEGANLAGRYGLRFGKPERGMSGCFRATTTGRT
jgi:hypothetical protein